MSRLYFYPGEDGKFSLTKPSNHKFCECFEKVGNDWYYSKSYLHPRSPVNRSDIPDEILKVVDLTTFLLGE